VLLESFPIIVIEKQLRRHSSYVIERLLRGHLVGIFTISLKLLKAFDIEVAYFNRHLVAYRIKVGMHIL